MKFNKLLIISLLCAINVCNRLLLVVLAEYDTR